MTRTDTNNNNRLEAHSNAYLVRLRAVTTDGEHTWCGRVQHLISGQAFTFRTLEDLPGLIAALQFPLDSVEGGEVPDES